MSTTPSGPPRPSPPDALTGRTLAQRYRLDALIGKGGFGAVYRATQHPVGRTVAVKVIRRMDDQEGLRRRFFREARVLSRLSGPDTVTLFDYGEEPDGLLYMVQEFVDGRSLSQILGRGERLEPHRVARIAARVLGALAEAHRLGIVHRDIKPGNVMLATRDRQEAVRVLDFGVAKLLTADEDDSFETVSGIALGTPTYMAPEQAVRLTTGPEADQYSVGILMWRMLMGRVPFRGLTHYETLKMHVEAPLPPLDGVDPVLAAVIERSLAKDPRARFADADAMRDALLAFIDSPGGAQSLPTAPPDIATTSIDMQEMSFDGPTLAVISTDRVVAEDRAEGAAAGRWLIPALVAVAVLLAATLVALLLTPSPTSKPRTTAMDIDSAAVDAGPLDARSADAAAATDAAVDGMADVTVDATPDATPAPPRPRPRPRARRSRARPTPPPDRATALGARLDRAVEACRCDDARAMFSELGGLDPAAADARKARMTRACNMIGVGCNR